MMEKDIFFGKNQEADHAKIQKNQKIRNSVCSAKESRDRRDTSHLSPR